MSETDTATPAASARVYGGVGAPNGASVNDRLKAMMSAQFGVRAALSEAENWKQAEAGVASLLEEATPVDEWAIRQIAAFEMLDQHLLTGNPSTEKADAAAQHVALIVEVESPDLEIVARSVRMYGDLWGSELTQDLSRRAIHVGRERLATLADCDDCKPEGARFEAVDGLANQQTTEISRLEAVVQELEGRTGR